MGRVTSEISRSVYREPSDRARVATEAAGEGTSTDVEESTPAETRKGMKRERSCIEISDIRVKTKLNEPCGFSAPDSSLVATPTGCRRARADYHKTTERCVRHRSHSGRPRPRRMTSCSCHLASRGHHCACLVWAERVVLTSCGDSLQWRYQDPHRRCRSLLNLWREGTAGQTYWRSRSDWEALGGREDREGWMLSRMNR